MSSFLTAHQHIINIYTVDTIEKKLCRQSLGISKDTWKLTRFCSDLSDTLHFRLYNIFNYFLITRADYDLGILSSTALIIVLLRQRAQLLLCLCLYLSWSCCSYMNNSYNRISVKFMDDTDGSESAVDKVGPKRTNADADWSLSNKQPAIHWTSICMS